MSMPTIIIIFAFSNICLNEVIETECGMDRQGCVETREAKSETKGEEVEREPEMRKKRE